MQSVDCPLVRRLNLGAQKGDADRGSERASDRDGDGFEGTHAQTRTRFSSRSQRRYLAANVKVNWER